MTAAPHTIQLRGLGQRKMGELSRKAKRLGMTPEKYLKRLVEEDLAISHEARTKTFAQIMGGSRNLGEEEEEEIDRLVERAKTQYHERKSKKR